MKLPTRIFRLKQRTLSWCFKIVHVPGKSIPASDVTSRNPANTEDDSSPSEWLTDYSDNLHSINHNHDIKTMGDDIIAANRSSLKKIKVVTWDRVKESTILDPHLTRLKQFIVKGFRSSCNDMPVQIQQYWRYRDDL